MVPLRTKDYKHAHPMKIFLSYYLPHKHLFILDMVCALIICLIDLAFPYVSRLSMRTLLPERQFEAFFHVVVIFAIAYICKGILYFIVSYWGHLFGVRVEADLRRDLFSHMESLSFSFFDKLSVLIGFSCQRFCFFGICSDFIICGRFLADCFLQLCQSCLIVVEMSPDTVGIADFQTLEIIA